MAGSAQNDDEEISGINVTPLVDIMLVLVIILMVTAEFAKFKLIPVQLPKVNAAAMEKEPQKITLSIRGDSALYWNDKLIEDMESLEPNLRSEKAANPEIAVILRAEKKTEYDAVLRVLDQVKSAGIAKVGLAVEPLSAK